MSFSPYYVQQCRDRIVALAQAMLMGDLSFIEGARQICDLTGRAQLDIVEQPFAVFMAIDNETDAVPVGELRERWHPEAKVTLAPEWERAEDFARTYGDPACRDAITWLAGHRLDGS
jgi:hypothetical protein